MIRVGRATSLSHQLNTFHAQVTVTSGFFIPVTSTPVPPTPTDTNFFGSDLATPPYIGFGRTLFASKSGKLNIGTSVQNAYLVVRVVSVTSNGTATISVSYRDAFSAIPRYIFPNVPSLDNSVYLNDVSEVDALGKDFFLRFDEKSAGSEAVRVFFENSASSVKSIMVISQSSMANYSSGTFTFSDTRVIEFRLDPKYIIGGASLGFTARRYLVPFGILENLQEKSVNDLVEFLGTGLILFITYV